MLSEMIIPKKRTRELELDQKQLYAIGLSHAQKLSNRIWTDYNVHDPGITIIELISYALTDLGYRASYPVKDLLSSETDNKANMAKQFFTASQVNINFFYTNSLSKIYLNQSTTNTKFNKAA